MRMDSKTVSACSRAILINEFASGCENCCIKKLLSGYGIAAVRCAAAAQDILCGTTGNSWLKSVEEVIRSGECFLLSDLAVSGSDLISLGHASGPGLGRTLSALLDHVIQHPEDNTREALLKIIVENADK